jgi:hypothetical protein
MTRRFMIPVWMPVSPTSAGDMKNGKISFFL